MSSLSASTPVICSFLASVGFVFWLLAPYDLAILIHVSSVICIMMCLGQFAGIECIVDELSHRNTSNCPKCGTDLGCNPLERLRSCPKLMTSVCLHFSALHSQVVGASYDTHNQES